MKIYSVSGEFLEKGKRKKFSKKIKALSSEFAAEKVLCLFGSKNKIKRRHIYLNEVKEIGESNG